MKKFAFLFLMVLGLVLPFSSVQADSWDCMNRETADRLADFLSEHPYIVDYCDLCDNGISEGEGQRYPLTLLHVTNVRVEVCSWDSDQWSVIMDTEPMLIGHLVEGFNYKKMSPFPGNFPEEEISFLQGNLPASLNYQWTLLEGQAVRLGDAVGYEMQMDSPAISEFPASSFITDKVEKKGYDEFLKSHQ